LLERSSISLEMLSGDARSKKKIIINKELTYFCEIIWDNFLEIMVF